LKLTERHLVNALVGLCKVTRFWPSDLHNLGYKVHSIEQPFSNSKGVGITPDVILSNFKRNYAFVTECKSGGYVKQGQIDKYPHVTGRDVQVKALVASDDPTIFKADVMVFCVGERWPTIRLDLEENGWKWPVVGLFLGEKIQLLLNVVGEPDTDIRLRDGIPLSRSQRIPTHYVPIMSSHSTDYEIAALILPELVSRLRQGNEQFSVFELCEQLFQDMWEVIDPTEQSKIRGRVGDILHAASRAHFQGVLTRVTGSKTDIWRLTTPNDQKTEMSFYRGLRSRSRRFLEQLRRGGRRLDAQYTQLTPEDVQKEIERRQADAGHHSSGGPS
jgi:hypothetical protein